MDGTGATNADGGMTLSGTTKILGRSLNNAVGQTATWTGTGTILFNTDGILNNHGTFDVQSDGTIQRNANNAVIDNTGTFKKSSGIATTAVQVDFHNSGTVQLQSGTVNFSGSNSFLQASGSTILDGGILAAPTSNDPNFQGGSLAGSGTINADILNGGTITPGFSPGSFTINGDVALSISSN